MRAILKRTAPESFEKWKGMANPDWVPSFSVLPNPEKRGLHACLLLEQGFTCCYCGRSVDLDESHIEHFRPQHRFPALELDYNNMFASCQRARPAGTPIICGHHKGEAFDEENFLSPLLDGVDMRFSYALDGRVQARPADIPAQTMIAALALNSGFLVARRRMALAAVFDPQFIASATRGELGELSASFRRRDTDGKLTSFYHAIARFAEDLPQ